MLYTLAQVIAVIALVIAFIPVTYFTVITLAGLLPRKAFSQPSQGSKIAVVIPAHNEKLLIAETVKAAKAQNYAADDFTVVVIADNCTDETAELAREAGARVIERTGPPGKGQALFDTFKTLLTEQWDAFLIVDADSLLHAQGLTVLDQELSNGSKVIQLRYAIRNPEESVRTRALELGMASFNALRPKGRTALGMSSGIFGNGFCISREALETVPYLAHSIVEDIEYHIHLCKSGFKTVFTDKACVYAEMPTSVEASETQRVRWERGRWITIQSYARELWKLSLKGNVRAMDALSDLLTPPATLILYPLIIAGIFGGWALKAVALGMLMLLVLHYVIASAKYGSFSGLFRIACFVPWYTVWKVWIIVVSSLKEKNLGWNRTGRE
ncbi:MAG: glycosyltransferase family 2 protein [Pontibacterium sp.]